MDSIFCALMQINLKTIAFLATILETLCLMEFLKSDLKLFH